MATQKSDRSITDTMPNYEEVMNLLKQITEKLKLPEQYPHLIDVNFDKRGSITQRDLEYMHAFHSALTLMLESLGPQWMLAIQESRRGEDRYTRILNARRIK